jgi:hypothetical protein
LEAFGLALDLLNACLWPLNSAVEAGPRAMNCERSEGGSAMKTAGKLIVAFWALVTLLLPGGLILPGAALSDTVPGYVALGDSIEAGFGVAEEDGWVALFLEYLKALEEFGTDTDLVNLGTPGATARDIQHGQLASALVSTATHAPVVITWGGGGNDLRDFITSPQAATCRQGNPSCLARLGALLNEVDRQRRLPAHGRGGARHEPVPLVGLLREGTGL